MQKDNVRRALSIKQPWAWLIVNCYKDVENRSYKTKIRGRILVHASQSFDRTGYDWVREAFPHIPMPEPDAFRTGGIVGEMWIADCRHENEHGRIMSPWYGGQWAWIVRKARERRFLPLRGKLGFFKVEV